MLPRALRPWLLLFGLVSSACALTGYDFDQYQPATAGGGAAAESDNAKPKLTETAGQPSVLAGGNGGERSAGAGAVADGPGAAGAGCEPKSCFDLAVECGATDDGCGGPLDCGGCFWWFQDCQANTCQFTE
jgi:hypothetical protein